MFAGFTHPHDCITFLGAYLTAIKISSLKINCGSVHKCHLLAGWERG